MADNEKIDEVVERLWDSDEDAAITLDDLRHSRNRLIAATVDELGVGIASALLHGRRLRLNAEERRVLTEINSRLEKEQSQ